jgi:hypothetical protein
MTFCFFVNMKQKNILFVLPFLTAAFLPSCKKDVGATNPVSTNIADNQSVINSFTPLHYEELYDSIVKCGSLALVQIMQNNEYRQIINSEVSKAFDGDDNALFKNLNSAFNTQNYNLEQLMTASVLASTNPEYSYLVPQVINGFPYFESISYAQILIPNYESYNINVPHTVAQNTDDNDNLPGYKINNGVLQVVNVDEQYANENPVYVVMVNERVNSLGIVSSGFIKDSNEDETLLNKVTNRAEKSLRELKISRVKVWTKKEKWGRADVTFLAATYGGVGNVCDNPKARGGDLNKFSTNEMSTWKGYRWTIPAIFWPVSDKDDAWKPERTCYVVLYEYDKRNKWSKTMSPTGCSNIKLTFSAKQGIYGDVYPSRNDFRGVPKDKGTTKIYGFAQAQLEFESDWIWDNI